MPSKDYAKIEDQASQEQASQASVELQVSDMNKVLSTLQLVFSDLRSRLEDETVPAPEAARTAATFFNIIVARLGFD